jgi:hypothetical protein
MAFPVVAMAAAQSHNAAMAGRLTRSLAFWALAVGVVSLAGARAAPAKASSTVTLHRCTDARGKVTWQDDACPKGSQDEVREMVRPTDAPTPKPAPVAPRAPAPPPEPEPEPQRELLPPPAMYQCTSYDNIQRYSESYDPNPRCEPLVLYYPFPQQLTQEQALSCRWVEDSCVRLSDAEACGVWRDKHKEAISLEQRAFSDTRQYRQSELRRIGRIIEESCP